MKTLYILFLKHFLLLVLLSLYLSPFFLSAQSGSILIQENPNIDLLVKSLFPDDGSIIIENVQFTGDSRAIGSFSNGMSSINVSNGLVLSTGKVIDAVGPNNLASTTTEITANSTAESDLEKLLTTDVPLYDLARLEFDIISTNPNFSIDYIFASEEYCEYVESSYTDVFGIFLSGPNIVDTFSNQATNLAILPDKTDYVGIRTVNWNSNKEYYQPNSSAISLIAGGCSFGEIFSTAVALDELEYDGFTTVLKAEFALLPEQQYHVKIGIADSGDKKFDSAIFLTSKSEIVEPEICSFAAKWSDNQEFINEGCGVVNFQISSPLLNNPSSDFSYTYQVSEKSTAIEGEDFQILTGSSTNEGLSFPIEIFKDELIEGEETIVLEISFNCGDSVIELTKKINDIVPFDISLRDTIVCPGEMFFIRPIVSSELNNLAYLWNDGSTEDALFVGGFSDERVIVEVKDECGQTKSDSAFIKISANDLKVDLNIFGKAEFCKNELFDIDFNLINFNGELTNVKWDLGGGKIHKIEDLGPLKVEFLTNGEKEIRLQIATNSNCNFGIDTTFKIMVNDCSDGLLGVDVDYELAGYSSQNSTNLDSLTTSGTSFLNKDFLLSTNGLSTANLTFPLLEKKGNEFHNLLRIYNNLGQLVFEKKEYHNDWEGQHQNGQKLATGTYFYNLTFGRKQQHYQSGKIVFIQ